MSGCPNVTPSWGHGHTDVPLQGGRGTEVPLTLCSACAAGLSTSREPLGTWDSPWGTQGSPWGHRAALGDTGQPSGTHASPTPRHPLGVPPAPDPLASPQGDPQEVTRQLGHPPAVTAQGWGGHGRVPHPGVPPHARQGSKSLCTPPDWGQEVGGHRVGGGRSRPHFPSPKLKVLGTQRGGVWVCVSGGQREVGNPMGGGQPWVHPPGATELLLGTEW